MDEKTADFGFEKVSPEEKGRRVTGVFESVASRYDLMNDIMSFGLHRLWKRFTLELGNVRAGETVLDLAGGTGDLTRLFAKRVGHSGLVVLADINRAMLETGRDRLLDHGVAGNVAVARLNGERLPFAERSFDCICIGFGLRNFTDKQTALQAARNALRSGGRLLILEFSKPRAPGLAPLYDAYSFRLLPLLGRWIARDEDSYRYLAESIRVHPDQETLKGMMEQAGLERCEYFSLCGGIVAVHRGYRLS